MTADGQWLTFLALLLPFAAAAIAPVLTKALKHNAAWVLALAPALIFLHFTGFVGTISSGETLTGGYVWIPSLSVDFSWFLDCAADHGHRHADRALFRRLSEGT